MVAKNRTNPHTPHKKHRGLYGVIRKLPNPQHSKPNSVMGNKEVCARIERKVTMTVGQ